MTLPFRRHSRPRGPARLALAGDFPGTGEPATGPLQRDDWDGTTIEFAGTSGAGLPGGIAYRAATAQDAPPATLLRAGQSYRPTGPAAPQPPAFRPPAIRPLAPELPPRGGLPAAQVTAMLDAVRYPGADGTPEDYAAVMRRWSHLTGTESGLESPGAWPRHTLEAVPGLPPAGAR